MTEREQRLIELYLPRKRDESLDKHEFYVCDTADRVRKVYVSNIFPGTGLYEPMEYDVYEVGTNRRIDCGMQDPFRGFTKGRLYDNREDCRDHVHGNFDQWEELREVQEGKRESIYE